jgi:hypothetical protein
MRANQLLATGVEVVVMWLMASSSSGYA